MELSLDERRQRFAVALGLNSWADYEAECDRIVVEHVTDSPLLSGFVLRQALAKAGLHDVVIRGVLDAPPIK